MNKRVIRKSWFNPLSGGTGMWAFLIHRVSGLGLVGYLFLHLAVLNILRGGPDRWDAFVALVRSPIFIGLDALLLAGVLLHGINGLRLTMVGLGLGLRYQKQMFWLVLILSGGLLGWGMIKFLTR